jgi:hypothetical protein
VVVFIFRSIVLIARVTYWISGFAFLAGLGVWFFSTSQDDLGLILAGAGIGMWILAKILAPMAILLFERMDENQQETVDPYREIRASQESPWGL